MATMFVKGDRVFVPASFFDAPNTDNAWSKANFSNNWQDAKCFGTVISVSNKIFANVKWDIDKSTTKVKFDVIKLQEPRQEPRSYLAVPPSVSEEAENVSVHSSTSPGNFY